MQGKKVLITGGCGFIGSNLTRRLLELGAEVSIFKRAEDSEENISNIKEKLKIIEGDLTNEEDVINAIKGKDFLFHLAWQTDLKKSMINPKQDIQNDLIGLINILESCRKENPNVKIIFASSVTVIGETEEISPKEEHREDPISTYEINKLSAEKYLQMYYKIYGLKTCILRLSNVFGEYQRIDNPNRGVLNFMVGRALRGEELTVYGEGDFIRDYCYIQNYIDAFVLVAESEKTNGNFYMLGSGEGKTFVQIVEKIKEIVERLTGKKVEIEHIPFPGDSHNINKRNFIADYSKFNKATDWEPKISFEEGLEKTIKFYLKHTEK